MTDYIEHQRFAIWVYVLFFASLVILGAAVTLEDEEIPKGIVFLIGIIMLVSCNMLYLTIRITDNAAIIKFGYLFPLFYKRIPLESVKESSAVSYRPIRDAGGWGIRFGRFRKRFTTFYNARGNRGVLIITDRRQFVIGSQDPEQLHAVILSKIGTVRFTGSPITD